MPTLEDTKRKKMGEMLQQNMQQSNEEARTQQQIEQLESVVRQYLTKEALVRYGSLKTAHPEKAIQLLILLVQAIQQGQIRSEINDAMLKKILEQITPKQREIKIRRV